jgi:uncharacterized protein (TIGR01777 family)
MIDRPRVVLAGGSGFLGRALADVLAARGYEPVVLSRSPSGASEYRQLAWDGRTPGPWVETLDGARAIVNLTGKSIDCRYTPENRRLILSSRVDSVKALAAGLARCAAPPAVWVQCSAVAYYGNGGDTIFEESSPPGSGFSSEVCAAWEAALAAADEVPIRKLPLRIGIVLDRHGGALPKLERIVRSFLGGASGSGRQYVSWIHLADLLEMFVWALERDLRGPFNATAPAPVTNAQLMSALRAGLHRPWSPPVPAPFVKVGATLMGTEAELALNSTRAVPKHFLESGFQFRFPELHAAMADLYPRYPR